MTRICAHCGTEVDGDALFCPTCGQPFEAGVRPELPPAPDWPELPPRPPPDAEPAAPAAPDADVASSAGAEPGEGSDADADADADTDGRAEPAPRSVVAPGAQAAPPPVASTTHAWEQPVSEQPVPPWRRGAAYRAVETDPDEDASAPAARPPLDPPPGAPPPSQPAAGRQPAAIFSVPVLLSDWLVGIGAMTAAVAMFLPWVVGGRYTSGWGLASGMNMLFTIVLLAVLVVVFTPELLPRIPQRSLLLLSVGLVGTGIGLDRLGLPVTGVGGIVFLIASLVIATGGALAQLGQDRAVGGPQA